MKYILALITGIVFALPLHAQPNTTKSAPCTDPWCIDASFNYQFCDTRNGNRVDKCSKDPNNEPFLKVVKHALPLRLCANFYSGNLYNNVQFQSNPDPLDPHNVDVFVNSHMIDRLNDAAARWASPELCPNQGPNKDYEGQCCLRVGWTTRDSDMGEYLEGAAANTHIQKARVNGVNCQTDCANSFMAVNQQPTHTRFDERGRPRFFISTEPTPWAVIPADQDYQYVYAYSMFLHELGHWLGFNHSDGTTAENGPCNHSSIMDVSGYPRSWIIEQRDLTAEDACMFKKLYCCENTKAGVNEVMAPSLAFMVLPNPARSSVTLRLPTDFKRVRTLTIRVVDVSGSTIREKRLEETSETIPIDLTGVTDGVYMLTLSNGHETYGKKIVVQH